MRLRRIVVRGLTGCTIFFNIISQTERFSEKKAVDHKTRFDFLCMFCQKHFSL
jgi:hypothetical protein